MAATAAVKKRRMNVVPFTEYSLLLEVVKQ
jgi:hypothetical protein